MFYRLLSVFATLNAAWNATLLEFLQLCCPSQVISHQRLSSIKSRLPSKGIFHQRSTSFKSCHPSKVIFHQRVSSITGRLPSKVFFHCGLSFVLLYQMCSKSSTMSPYHFLLPKPFNKLTMTGRQKKPLIRARACTLPKNNS